MINKIIGFLACLSFILNMIFTAIPANSISDSIDTIYNDKEADYGLYHVDIGLSSGVNLLAVSSLTSYDLAVKHCSLQPCKVYGLNFGPHTREGQDPNQGGKVSEEQVRELLAIISPFTDWIRTYSCLAAVEMVNDTGLGHELGFKVAGGAWLTDNLTNNEKEISCIINIAQAGDADMLIVGSEVLYRSELTENQLIEADQQPH